MNFASLVLKSAGWQFINNTPLPGKCIICVAPHTSNWDFILGELAIRSCGLKSGFLMKSTWFFFPLGNLLRSIGGIAVKRGEHGHLTTSVAHEFASCKSMAVAITPEGTRSPNSKWHSGLFYMAQAANVPIILAYFDYKAKIICIDKPLAITGDIEADMQHLKEYYASHGHARYPSKFIM